VKLIEIEGKKTHVKTSTTYTLYGKKKCCMGQYWKHLHKTWPEKYAPICPDGIGWQGFYFDHHQMGGTCLSWTSHSAATGTAKCEQYTCIDQGGNQVPTQPKSTHGLGQYISLCKWPGISPFKGVCQRGFYCDREKKPDARQVCQKMQVVHVNEMSRSAGVLMAKRTSCKFSCQNWKGQRYKCSNKCSVFKTGLCIDLGEDVWSSTLNNHHSYYVSIADAEGGMLKQAQKFGELAAALLKKHANTLPEEYACSDTRHEWKVEQRKHRGRWNCWKKGTPGDPHGCEKHKDATLARLAILNF